MRTYSLLTCGAVAGALLSSPAGAGPAKAVPAAWRDLDGRSHLVRARGEDRATVLIFGSTDCPCADEYSARVAELDRTYRTRGARFFLVFSAEGTTETAARQYAAKRKLAMPVVLDTDRALAKAFGARVTPTAVLLDDRGKVRYAGLIDDSADVRLVKRQYLRDALEGVLKGGGVRQARTQAYGCAVAGKAPASPAERPVRLLPGLGEIRFAATTRSPQAQRFFKQGMALWYGFNFDEAERSFREAARLDPQCAMAYWGTALSLGMNYNWDFDPEREAEVYRLVRRAVELSPAASERERALIQALTKRHTDQPNPDRGKLLQAYADEMRRVSASRPDDLDIASLFAASMMDLRPWDLWTWEGQPQPGTPEIVSTLERALAKDSNHIGANHLYIHAVEASRTPERALPSARRLGKLAPGSGHLVHMPAHIYQRIGDFRSAATANRGGANVDSRFIGKDRVGGRYVAYYIHNLDFLVWSHSMAGRYGDALAAARELTDVIARHRPKIRAANCPSAAVVTGDVLVRFGKWDEILKQPEPADDDLAGRLFDVYARGVALAAKGDVARAEKALQRIDAAEATLGAAFATTTAGTPYAKAGPLLIETARGSLAGRIALAKGDLDGAVAAFRKAVAAQDQIPYAEPALWRSPVRESLGGALLRAGRAAEAEQVFRDDLKRNRGNGRSLFGLARSLEAQGKAAEAKKVREQFRKAWEHADTQLALGRL